jgi:predicted nucleic acid-binding protein
LPPSTWIVVPVRPSATETADIADAHVVVCARRAGQRVVTSDPDDLARFDPDLELVIV